MAVETSAPGTRAATASARCRSASDSHGSTGVSPVATARSAIAVQKRSGQCLVFQVVPWTSTHVSRVWWPGSSPKAGGPAGQS